MIALLSAIGRIAIVLAALIAIGGGAVAGVEYARAQEVALYGVGFTISNGGVITPREIGYAVAGAILGLIVSGVVFGVASAIYEIRDSLRALENRLP